VLHDKYLFPKQEADALASFLTPMLRLNSDKRAKASDLVHHNWLEGVVVQGELDVIRRAEQMDGVVAEGHRGAPAHAHAAADPALVMAVAGLAAEAVAAAAAETKEEKMQRTQSEADALKPVDDVPPQ
jgi:serine/threonine-protein kinase SRPK3